MFKTAGGKKLIVCISLLVLMLAAVAFAETIGQKTLRLRRGRQKSKTEYSFKPVGQTEKSDTGEVPETDAGKSAVALVETAEDVKLPAKSESVETPGIAPVVKPGKMPSGDPLNMVPGGTFVCVRINKFGDSVARLDEYLKGVSPMPLSMLVTGQIGNLFGNPMLTGINFTGDVVLFGKKEKDSTEPYIALLLPVTSYDSFTADNQNCSKPDAKGISTITPPQSFLGKLVTAEAPGGKYAVVAPKAQKKSFPEIVKLIKESSPFSSFLSENEQKRASEMPLWVYGNIDQMVVELWPEIEKGLEGVQAQAAAQAGQMGQMDADQQKKNMDILKDGIKQLKSLSIALNPTPEKLTLSVSFAAKKATPIANALVADPTLGERFEYAGYFSEPAAMIGLWKINKPVLKNIMNLVNTMIPEGTAGMTPNIKTYIEKYISMLGNEAAFSMSAGGSAMPFSIKQIYDFDSEYKPLEVIEEQLKLATESAKAQSDTTVETVTSDYKGNKIYSMEMPSPMAPGQKGSISLSSVKNMGLYVMGDKSNMHSLIDKVSAGVPSVSGDIKKALDLVDNSGQMDFVASLNIIRLIGIGSKAMMSAPVPGGKMIGGMLGGIKGETNSCLALAGKIHSGRIDGQAVLPKAHLMEVMAAFMKMQQQMMQQRMQNQ